jgi:MYXO-CTERM domain-containing protein
VSTKAKGCGCASGGEGAAGTGALFGLLALVLVRKRKHT